MTTAPNAALQPTDRTTLKRARQKGRYDRDLINAILDEALVAHVGFVQDGAPIVLPLAHWRIDDHLYIHGARKGRLFKALASGAPACVTVTLLDALVIARSAFHHSMNHRSVTIFGAFEAVEAEQEKRDALDRLMTHIVPGRAPDAPRPASAPELKATAVLRIPIAEASAKVRTGHPVDDEPDHARPVWAGIVPLGLAIGAAEPDPLLADGIPMPEAIGRYRRPVTK